jgi:hypothetical protein
MDIQFWDVAGGVVRSATYESIFRLRHQCVSAGIAGTLPLLHLVGRHMSLMKVDATVLKQVAQRTITIQSGNETDNLFRE